MLAALVGCEPQPTPVYGIPYYSDLPRDAMGFDCDAAVGFRSEWRQPIGAAGKIRGAVYFASVRRSSVLANVMVRGEKENDIVSLSFSLDNKHLHIQPEVRTYDAAGKRFTQPLRARPTKGAEFLLEWEPHRVRIRLDAGAPWLDVPISFAPEQVKLGCSDGNAVFHSIRVEPVTVAAPEAASANRRLPTNPPGAPPQNVPPTLLARELLDQHVAPDAKTGAQMVTDGISRAIASFKVCIDDTGALSALELLRSTGYPAYDDELEVAIENHRYEPYRIADRAVPACTALTFVYQPSAPHPETPRERALREWDEQQAHPR